MYRFIIVIFFSFQVIIVSAQENSIEGKWTGIDDKGESAIITFYSNTATMEFGGEKASPFDYEIDYTKDPIRINLIMKNEKQQVVIPALVKFLDSNKIKWEVFPYATTTPLNFSSESNEINETTIVLTRIK